MLLLTTTAFPTMRKWDHPDHGRLLTPRHYCSALATAEAGIPWAMDNDGFGGVDDAAFRRMVTDLAGIHGCRFLNAPDVFYPDGSEAHEATIAAWHRWLPFLRVTGFPLSFVLQVGATVDGVPWDDLDAVFIGGTTEWKLGPEARAIVGEAKRRGKWVHMGRVNSMKRIGYAKAIGCDSVDGTGWAKYRNAMMPLGLAALDQQVMELGA